MQTLIIAPPENKDGTERKGRSFRAYKVCHITADGLWSGAATDEKVVRPIFLQLAGGDVELRSFVANLRQGKLAEEPRENYKRDKPIRYELLRSQPYTYTVQRVGDSALTTVLLDGLTALDPGLIDPQRVAFVCLTPEWWAKEAAAALAGDGVTLNAIRRFTTPGATDEQLLREAAYASRWAAFLEKRTRRPFLPGIPFAVFLYRAAFAAGLAGRSAAFGAYQDYDTRRSDRFKLKQDGLTEAGIADASAALATQDQIDALLARSVSAFRALEVA